MHDFIDPAQGRATPYGVYDLRENEAWVSVGISHDTAEFAVQTIRTWWKEMGAKKYPGASSLVITRRRAPVPGHRLSFAARHQPMEQDRAPAIFVHYLELARKAARYSPSHRQPHRSHDYEDGSGGA